MRSPWVSSTLAALLIFGLGFGVWMAWQASVEAQPADAEFTDARVTDVVDGDTIDVSPPVQGVDRVRLIGVDTPETFGGEEPCGPEASAFTKEQLAGEQIQLEFDEGKKDQYNRALAYVWRGDELFNETLVRQGYAEVLTIAPNDKYADRFLAAQEQAEAENLGIWGPGGCAASEPTPEPTTPTPPDPVPEPQPDPKPVPKPRPEPSPRDLMEAGGPMEPPYPTMMNGSCPEDFPVRRADGCYPR